MLATSHRIQQSQQLRFVVFPGLGYYALHDLTHLFLRWFGIALSKHLQHGFENRPAEVFSARPEVMLYHDIDGAVPRKALNQFERHSARQGDHAPSDPEGVEVMNRGPTLAIRAFGSQAVGLERPAFAAHD